MWNILLTLVMQSDTRHHHPYQLAEFDNWKIGFFLQISMLLAGYDWEALKNWWNVHTTGVVIIKRFASAGDTETKAAFIFLLK